MGTIILIAVLVVPDPYRPVAMHIEFNTREACMVVAEQIRATALKTPVLWCVPKGTPKPPTIKGA